MVAAIIGGIAGGLIVKATWDSGDGSAAAGTGSGSKIASVCPAATVAERALPSVVTVRPGGGQGGPAAEDEGRSDAGDGERGGGAAQERTAWQEYCLAHGFLRGLARERADYRRRLLQLPGMMLDESVTAPASGATLRG